MSNAVLRSLTGMFDSATSLVRPRHGRRARLNKAAPRVTGTVAEPLEERRLFALVVNPLPASASATTLGAALLLPNTGITITGGTYVGANNQGGTYSGFDTTSAQTGERLVIQDGVLLTTGLATNALGPNTAPDVGATLNTPGDTQLDGVTNNQTLDANSLTLTFTADVNTKSILFDFIFGTEQYPEFIGAFRNDTFAAFLDGANVSFDAAGRAVSLANTQVDNRNADFNIQYDGLTPRVRTTAPLNTTLTTHTLKFVIGDADLGDFDSGVFLARLQGSSVATPAAITQVPSPGGVGFDQAGYTVDEAAGTATVTVLRTGGASGQVSVDYSTTPTTADTATAGVDYTPVSGTIVFADGQTSQTFTVPILDDTLTEGDETLGLKLANAVDAFLAFPAASTLTIQDNERAVAFVPQSVVVNEDSGTATLTVSRTGDLTGTVTVDYVSADGPLPPEVTVPTFLGTPIDPATANQDYTPVHGTLTIPENQKTATITVPIIADFNDAENNEALSVTLSNPVGSAAPTGLGAHSVGGIFIENVTRPPTIYDVTAFAPKGKIEALYLQVNQDFTPASVLNPANYNLFLHKEKNFNSANSRQKVAIRSVEYNATLRTITVRPMSVLKNNVFYEIDVRGTGADGLVGTNGQPLDGNIDRAAGDDFVGYFGRGTSLLFNDHDGDQVKLGATGGGVIEVFRDVTRNARQVRYLGATPPKSAIFGKVNPAKHDSDKVTHITILLLGGANNYLANPPFSVDILI